MLKLTYTESGFYLEYVAQPLEDWVMARVMLALRVGTGFHIEPSTASFLLPANLPQLRHLERQQESEDAIALSVCDADYVEVNLQGTWITSDSERETGIFVTSMSYAAEFFLFKLWQESQAHARCLP